MQLWLDNTGLQTAALCLQGKASLAHRYDVDGLLQLATLLIYGNKLSLTGFEYDTVNEGSRKIAEEFHTIGITKDILSIVPTSEVEYALACRTVADSIAHYLCDDFRPEPTGVQHFDFLPPALQQRWLEYLELANEKEGSAKLQDTAANALTDKAAGAVEYMMATSPALREAVKRLLSAYPDWGDQNTRQLNAFLRYQLNDALGEQLFSKYAPAVARAELVNRRNLFIVEALGKHIVDEKDDKKTDGLKGLLDRTVDELRAGLCLEPLGVPSTVAGASRLPFSRKPWDSDNARNRYVTHSKPLPRNIWTTRQKRVPRL